MVSRLWARDVSLWPGDEPEELLTASNLRWLDLPQHLPQIFSDCAFHAAAARNDGLDHTVLVGMGGSNLGARAVLNALEDPNDLLRVVDTLDPDALRRVESKIPLARTLFVFASKSGKRIETHALLLYFLEKLKALGVEFPSRQFVALTEENSYLASLANVYKFRALLFDPPGISSRYSGSLHLGIALAIGKGLDPFKVLENVAAMQRACGPGASLEANPAAALAAFLAVGAQQGRNRLIFLTNRDLHYFAYRIAQLVGTSTANRGRGLVPICGRSDYPVEMLQKKCLAVLLRTAGPLQNQPDQSVALRSAGIPLVEIEIGSPAELAAEIFKWEIATALACAPLLTNCFQGEEGQGNLAILEKQLTTIASRDTIRAPGRVKEEGITLFAEGQTRRSISVRNLREALRTFLELRNPDSFIAICPFFELTPAYAADLRVLRDRICVTLSMPVQISPGPRYMYALDRTYKEAIPQGIFIIITSEPRDDAPIPGAPYTFGELQMAFALTEFEALERARRYTIRLHLSEGPEKGLKRLADVVIQALAQIRRDLG